MLLTSRTFTYSSDNFQFLGTEAQIDDIANRETCARFSSVDYHIQFNWTRREAPSPPRSKRSDSTLIPTERGEALDVGTDVSSDFCYSGVLQKIQKLLRRRRKNRPRDQERSRRASPILGAGGGDLQGIDALGHRASGHPFGVEADESKGSFIDSQPQLADRCDHLAVVRQIGDAAIVRRQLQWRQLLL